MCSQACHGFPDFFRPSALVARLPLHFFVRRCRFCSRSFGIQHLFPRRRNPERNERTISEKIQDNAHFFQKKLLKDILIFLQFPFANGFLQRLVRKISRNESLKEKSNSRNLYFQNNFYFNQKSSKNVKIKSVSFSKQLFFDKYLSFVFFRF